MAEEQKCPFPMDRDPASGDQGRCPVSPGGSEEPVWEHGTREEAERIARKASGASRIDAERAAAMAVNVAEVRARARGQSLISQIFLRTLGKKLGYGHPLSDRTGVEEFTWTPEAEAKLAEVPEFCRELTRWRVEWTAHKRGLGTTITPEVMQVKYDMWGRVSHSIRSRERDSLDWTESALSRFGRVPEFVKGQVLEAVEGNARSLGAEFVDDAVVDLVIQKWIDTGDFHEARYGLK
jgi:hypothetical protein